jgi:L-iditol 2-dehydrogenase
MVPANTEVAAARVYEGLTGGAFEQIGGHEFCGRVEALADGVNAVAVGDVVSIDPRIACGTCLRCRAGLAPCA